MTSIEENRKLVAEKIMGLEQHFCFPIDGELWYFRKGELHTGTPEFSVWAWMPDEKITQAFELVDAIAKEGWWLKLTSPFRPGEPWHGGFTPHDTIGWNGRPDYAASGSTPAKAIFEAALLWVNRSQE